MQQKYVSREHYILYDANPKRSYHIYVYERSTGSCVMSLSYEYWQEAYARQSLNALVSMSKARIVTVPYHRTNKKSA